MSEDNKSDVYTDVKDVGVRSKSEFDREPTKERRDGLKNCLTGLKWRGDEGTEGSTRGTQSNQGFDKRVSNRHPTNGGRPSWFRFPTTSVVSTRVHI